MGLQSQTLTDGSIEKYKALFVVKGYTYREGINYEETFSSIVRFAFIRLLLAILAHLDWSYSKWMSKQHSL